MARHDLQRGSELGSIQALDDERAHRQVLEEGELNVRPQPVQDQVIRFGDGQLRRHERFTLALQDGSNRCMAGLVRIRLGIQRSGIDEERHYPLPNAFT
ncbi:MAG: hypothetical protein HW391_2112 [Chloroflexi bacterium]|nr:hypothetical protein [Chloroflexota bacterium]